MANSLEGLEEKQIQQGGANGMLMRFDRRMIWAREWQSGRDGRGWFKNHGDKRELGVKMEQTI
jgi:hypothetical protein